MVVVLSFFQDNPIGPFTLLLAIILTVPPLIKRLRLPDLVGLLLAGIAFGPNGLGWLSAESETMTLLSDIGVIYLLFVAGLEIELEEFRKLRHRALGFGSLTFGLPLLVGTLIGRGFGLGWNGAILLGSLLSSHTPLGYPIVRRLGVAGNEAVVVTIGGTILTDIAALLVLALCVAVNAGELTLQRGVFMVMAIALYVAVVLLGVTWVGREFLRRSGEDEGNQFLFVLLALFLAAVGAEVVGVEKIVGAFLAGLAVNHVLKEGPVKEKVVFVGSVLFIPIFFVDMGLLIDLPAFLKTLTSIWLCLSIVVGLVASKFLAALGSRYWYRYSWPQMLTMWSLSLPQVAATLAATLVGYRVGLLDERILNSVLVMMLITATLGPFITAQAAVRLSPPPLALPLSPALSLALPHRQGLTVLVPIANPLTEAGLIQLGALLRGEVGRLIALSVVTVHLSLDDEAISEGMARSQHLLRRAEALAQPFGSPFESIIRLDDDPVQGICRASREQQADLIVMGWSEFDTLQARLLGNVIDGVLRSAHCPVAMTRLLDQPSHLRRLLVPIKAVVPQSIQVINLAQQLATANQAKLTLLHVYDPRTPPPQLMAIKTQLLQLASDSPTAGEVAIKLVAATSVIPVILRLSRHYDLVIVGSWRHHPSSSLFTISDGPAQWVQELGCSVMMLGNLRA